MGDKHAVIFGSSAPVEGDKEYEEAYEVGKVLGKMGFSIVNGGYTGTMEATAKGAKEANSKAIGITSKNLDYVEPNKWLDEVISSKDMFERIKNYTKFADVYIILKGSAGTLHEFMAIWDLMSLNHIKKVPVICFGSFWKDIVEKVASVSKCDAAEAEHRNIVKVAETIEELKKLLRETN